MTTLTPFWTTRCVSSDIWKDWDRFFDEDATTTAVANTEKHFAPATEVVENDDHYALSLDLPGLSKEDIHIEAVNNILTISGERKREEHSETKKIQRAERSYGSFERSFTLPNSINTEKIEAHYENGVLDLFLPKTQIAQSRKVEVQAGKKHGLVNKTTIDTH